VGSSGRLHITDSLSSDFEFLFSSVELCEKYKDRWVAVSNGTVLASDTEFEGLERQLEQVEGIASVLVHYVSREPYSK
tara:strand:- start:229 stop:462 length:234 start_codon:yes stop_codon:yes gene_type:complete